MASDAEADAGWRDLLREGRAPVLALIVLADWVIAADALVTATIMPSVGGSLSAFAWFGWAAAGFLTGVVVAGASAGWLAERTGLRAAMMIAGSAFMLGCVMSALAPGIALFLLGRVLQGCAAGWLVGLIYVALAMLFPARHLTRVFAVVTSLWGVATLAGPLIGGLFADAGLWRGVFWLFAAQAGLFTAAAAFLIPSEAARTDGTSLPARPLVLLGAGIVALASAGVMAEAGRATLVAAIGIALLAGAILDDSGRSTRVLPKQASSPFFPLRAAYLTYFASSAAGVGFALYGPALLQFSSGLSALEAGYVVAAEALAWTAAALAVAGAGEEWRSRLIVAGTAAILGGTVALTLVTPTGSLIAIAAAGALLGAGFGLCYAFISRRVIGAFDEAGRARGSSAIGVVRNAGGAVGAALAGVAANAAGFASGVNAANFASVAAAAFAIAIPFAAVGLLAALRLTRTPATEASVQAAAAPLR
ncbi:MAG TPA: MFS transporter [Allosphingosinicella sp.]